MSILRHAILPLLLTPAIAEAQLPPVPVPDGNPITEEKRVLGKILFWDEQLSGDDSVACGTCHRPSAGGADPRFGLHPGELPGTIDDVWGSPGIRQLDAAGRGVAHPVFGDGPQVTTRTAPSVFGALWAAEVFWDGRAGSEFLDPASGKVLLSAGGALENQVLATLANPAEMAIPELSWSELERKLAAAAPLALADRWPDDVSAAIAANPSYPELFAAAFGDPSVSAARIALAIATYERTLVPDQTPWDRYQAGDQAALGPIERAGWQTMQAMKCLNCHEPPLFTSNDFFNVGLRRTELDQGRSAVSGEDDDAGAMRVPSLRNVGLRPRLMHTGEFDSVGAAVDFYRGSRSLPDTDDIPDGGAYSFTLSLLDVANVASFLSNSLTDPRVADEAPPFDRPRLASERR